VTIQVLQDLSLLILIEHYLHLDHEMMQVIILIYWSKQDGYPSTSATIYQFLDSPKLQVDHEEGAW
jgi:hypothetical protein